MSLLPVPFRYLGAGATFSQDPIPVQKTLAISIEVKSKPRDECSRVKSSIKLIVHIHELSRLFSEKSFPGNCRFGIDLNRAFLARDGVWTTGVQTATG